ncbi:hypothetical protein ACF0H5_008425 [Mactra antiquata]
MKPLNRASILKWQKLLNTVYNTIKRTKLGLWVVCTIILVLFYIIFKQWEKESYLPPNYDVSEFKPLQPEVTEDFPTTFGESPRIPHIIHQTYKDTLIPHKFVRYVKTFAKYNPNWKYYFWTDESARKLIAERHPDFLSTWDNYRSGLNKADALRYIVLYEFGGIYADIDVENMRSLDRATMKYTCIFPPEPLEQAILRLRLHYLINNAIMMCRPKHPFLKQMISALPHFRPMADPIDLAGPSFVTSQFLLYNNITGDQYSSEKEPGTDSSPYFYSGSLSSAHENGVYVPNTRYFLDTLDTHEPGPRMYQKMCTNSLEKLPLYQQRACADLQRRGIHRQSSKYVFTIHNWSQTYTKQEGLDHLSEPGPVDIHLIVPHAEIY